MPESRVVSRGTGGSHEAAILAVGTELLRHGRRDTNAEELVSLLDALGYVVAMRVIVGDDVGDIAGALTGASGRCPLVIVTGGLGPTLDDLTREGFVEAFGVPLREDPATRQALEEGARRRGYALSAVTLRQAHFPEGSTILPNPIGTAPGFLVELPGDRIVAVVPGVPAEMRRMVTEELLPRVAAIQRRAGWTGSRPAPGSATTCLKASGLTEARLQARLATIFADARGCELTILTIPGEITFLARGAPASAEAVIDAAGRLLGGDVFTRNPDAHLEDVVGESLAARGETLATAESCTGGCLSALVTSVPGASRWFKQGWTLYADAAKTATLGIPAGRIEEHGAVSEPVARAMAGAARRLSGTDWAIGCTGIAGPAGGTPDKPVGTVWIALAGKDVEEAREYRFHGDRETIRMLAARVALDRLRRHLRGGG